MSENTSLRVSWEQADALRAIGYRVMSQAYYSEHKTLHYNPRGWFQDYNKHRCRTAPLCGEVLEWFRAVKGVRFHIMWDANEDHWWFEVFEGRQVVHREVYWEYPNAEGNAVSELIYREEQRQKAAGVYLLGCEQYHCSHIRGEQSRTEGRCVPASCYDGRRQEEVCDA